MDIVAALEALPNSVIKRGRVRCSLDTPSFGTYLPDRGVASAATPVTHPVQVTVTHSVVCVTS